MTRKSIGILLLLILCAAVLAFSSRNNQENRVGQTKESEFAQNALENYITHMLDEKNVENYGFKNMKEAENAMVGDSISVYYISLEALHEYKGDSSVQEILIDAETEYFFVQFEKEICTKIEIVQIDGQWVAGEFGGIDTVQAVDRAIQKLPAALKENSIKGSNPPVLVQVPVLFATFLYVEAEDGSGYFMNASIDPERYRLKDGQIYAAEKILSILAELAKSIEADLVY